MKKKNIENVHIHIQDIPLKFYPRTKENKSKDYGKEIARIMIDLRNTNKKVQYSAQICIFNIKSIMQNSGFIPDPPEVFDVLGDFVYHYENYCYRAFNFREKLLQFLNAILPLGYREKDVRLQHFIINPTIKHTGLLTIIESFDKDQDLKKVVEDRHALTHRLYYGSSFDHYLRPKKQISSKSNKDIKKWFNDWKIEVKTRADMISKFTQTIYNLNHHIAPKIIAYKIS